MPEEPASAIVEIRCSARQIEQLKAIPNLVLQRPPMPTADAHAKIVYALADASAQDQARALGCDVTVIKSPHDYNEQIRNVYDNISDKPITID
jgi:hypothetical protein